MCEDEVRRQRYLERESIQSEDWEALRGSLWTNHIDAVLLPLLALGARPCVFGSALVAKVAMLESTADSRLAIFRVLAHESSKLSILLSLMKSHIVEGLLPQASDRCRSSVLWVTAVEPDWRSSLDRSCQEGACQAFQELEGFVQRVQCRYRPCDKRKPAKRTRARWLSRWTMSKSGFSLRSAISVAIWMKARSSSVTALKVAAKKR